MTTSLLTSNPVLSLMLAEVDEHLTEAVRCNASSVERGWKEAATYSVGGYALSGRTLLIAILTDGGSAMCQARSITPVFPKTASIVGLAAQADQAECSDAAEKLRELAASVAGPDNITVRDAIDALLDARSIIQNA